MDDKPRGQAPVVPYVRFLERRAWRAKIANDLRRLTEECIEIEVIRSETRGREGLSGRPDCQPRGTTVKPVSPVVVTTAPRR